MFIHERQKLFALRRDKTGELVAIKGETVYFDRKFQAKEYRDELEATAPDETFTVIPGPDNTFFKEGQD